VLAMIGIVTPLGSLNYGNYLQNYAMQQMLIKLGHNPETIVPNDALSLHIITQFRNVLKNKNIKYVIRRIRFLAFLKNRIHYHKFKFDLNSPDTNNHYNYLIFGSDQIWNLSHEYIKNGFNYYFGNFDYDTEKFSYAASMGIDYVPDQYTKQVKESLNQFTGLSVREESAYKVLQNIENLQSVVHIDPSLLLTPDEWLKFSKKPSFVKSDRFLLTYFLGKKSPELTRKIYDIAKENELAVYNLFDEWEENISSTREYLCLPSEFVWLFANCSLAITDSFHGSVFSIIFEKPFRWFSRNSSLADMNNRLYTLFNQFGTEKWCVGNLNEDNHSVLYCDYSLKAYHLTSQYQKAKHYLINHLKEDHI
jgi:hypothetical protein